MYITQSITDIVRADCGYQIFRHYGFEPSKKPQKENPFRDEKTSSFFVNPKGYFKDFGSDGIKGDALAFIQQMEKCDFKEACKIAGNIYGITKGRSVPATPYKRPQRADPPPATFLPASALERAVEASVFADCHFIRGLQCVWGFDSATVSQLVAKYHLFTSSKVWGNAIGFPYIDANGNIRELKVMDYDPATCKRVKEPKSRILFFGKKIAGKDANLRKCLFGEHQLSQDNKKTVAIAESEKTAIVCSVLFPRYIWTATGGKTGWKAETLNDCKALAGRKVILFPDLSKPEEKQGTFNQWKRLGSEIERHIAHTGAVVTISNHLKKNACSELREAGGDLADYMIGKNPKPEAPDQNSTDKSKPDDGKHEAATKPDRADVEAVEGRVWFQMLKDERADIGSPATTKEREFSFSKPEKWVFKEGDPVGVESVAVDELKEFFKNHIPPKIMTIAGVTADTAKMIAGHLPIIEAYRKNFRFNPYYERLEELKSRWNPKAGLWENEHGYPANWD